MITLKQIIPALQTLGVSAEHIEAAIAELRGLLSELDEVEVKGRQNVDTLLGCMMALDAIIGDEKGGEASGR
jgi:prefoldin subunit 5